MIYENANWYALLCMLTGYNYIKEGDYPERFNRLEVT